VFQARRGHARIRARFSVARMAADYARLLLGASPAGPLRAAAWPVTLSPSRQAEETRTSPGDRARID